MKKFLFCLSMLFVAASVCLTTSCDDEDVLNEYYRTDIVIPTPATPNAYTFKVDGKNVTLGQLKDILNSFNTPIDLTVSLVDGNGNLIQDATTEIIPIAGTQYVDVPVGKDQFTKVPIIITKRSSHSGGLIK